jgi:hypothetical protein
MTNGYDIKIYGDDYYIVVSAMGDTPEEAFTNALYTLINSKPKLDLFDIDLTYEAEFLEQIEI